MDLMTITELARSAWVVWLTLIFASILFWAFRPKNKKRWEDDAMMIFKNDKGDKGGHAHG
ncbi:MAG: cbb3-type cytochrome c oxidase subunit 3 [Magnetovibrio sp.]|nr:cbb3-type cytochrome c oxidase subunit 3 [Magnetovibrio sp.]